MRYDRQMSENGKFVNGLSQKPGNRKHRRRSDGTFGSWLRRVLAPDGLPDVLLAMTAGALAWIITDFLKSMFG